MYPYNKSPDSKGQGLVEYALLLSLVAVVVIGILAVLGPTVANVFSQVNAALGGGSNVAITKADYNSTDQELHLDATVDGDYDPSVTLTASPGGIMEERAHHYHLRYGLTGCPCTITITSSTGGTTSVTVGP